MHRRRELETGVPFDGVVSRPRRRGDTVAAVSSAARSHVADEDTAPGSQDRTAGRERGRGARVRLVAIRFTQWWGTPAAVDLMVGLIYLAFAFWLFRGLWPDPATRAIADNVNDQSLIEWFLANGTLVWTGDFSLVSDRLNAPVGVNLMSNASHIAHGVIMAPVTFLFGVPVSFALLVAINLAATAAGWYLLFARGLRLGRGAALVGGAVAGFAPGMIAQSNSHLHMTAQWLVPPIVWCVIRLTRVETAKQAVRPAVGLALLVTVQVFLGEEVLYLTALTMALFAVAYAVSRPRWAREVAGPFLLGMLIAVGISIILLAYPLSVQFAGRQHTSNAPFASAAFYSDVASYFLFSPLSLAGSAEAGRLATSSAEYNTYLGLPLVLVLLAIAAWRLRSPVTIAVMVSAAVMTLLSLGPNVTFEGRHTGWLSPYGWIADVPVISAALPTRYSLALIPLIAVLLAYGLHAAARTEGFLRLAVPVAVAASLLPLTPMPLATTDRRPVPTFISSGAWRQCVPEAGVLVPVPLPTPKKPDSMRWPAAANVRFAIPEGFFIGPHGPRGKSSIGIYPQPTSQLLASVAATGAVPDVDNEMRAQARKDLEFWRADCVALAHGPTEAALHRTLEALLGPGTRIADTWTWKINH